MKAIVAGGGVAGAAAGLALARTGVRVRVYESHEDPAGPVGSFVSLAANGLRGLRALGVLDAVQAAGFPVERQRLWSGSGRLMGDVPRGRLSGDPLHSVTLMRADLVRELRAAALAAGAEIVTGARVTGAEHAGGGVRVALADGGADEADLLVGADGIWSATRRVLDPAAPEPAFGGQYSLAGTADPVPGADPGTFNMMFCRAGAFIAIAAPGGAVWWAAQVTAGRAPDLGAVALDVVRDLFPENMPAAVLRAATAVHRPTLHHVLKPVRVWRDDRVVLVGDASHPVGAGQGASMAIEDAAVLAHALRARGGVAAGLASYEADRRERVASLVKMAAANRDAKTAGPVARRVRDAVMPVVLRLFYERSTAWLYTREPVLDGAAEPAVATGRAG
ncbi:FAD-dependent oxidoreductase [Actinomadura parmotrematis]|uniref:FAD-dependent monooxygenase n=1 Tax=Actinomadura parmotrematis TaxID=2864039 RepID=A0ABS7G482_9ACTN|nr:NAD(P)/FAD-dependent oxidoreductase [Actinomadura parmotrematis]MBW8486458.1 FAD-dependent monooxygenase [Actinomadura parmotrematis]